MTSNQAHVVLKLDTSRFEAAMRQMVEALSRFARTPAWAYLEHQQRHHLPEDPARSAMHTAYDQRRRARRRRHR